MKKLGLKLCIITIAILCIVGVYIKFDNWLSACLVIAFLGCVLIFNKKNLLEAKKIVKQENFMKGSIKQKALQLASLAIVILGLSGIFSANASTLNIEKSSAAQTTQQRIDVIYTPEANLSRCIETVLGNKVCTECERRCSLDSPACMRGRNLMLATQQDCMEDMSSIYKSI